MRRPDIRKAVTDADWFAAFARMEEILAEEVPYVPLHHINQAYLVHPSIHGWRENRVQQVDWRELWLEAPRRTARR